MSELPTELIVSPEKKLVHVTPEVNAALPNVQDAFERVDQAFLENPDAQLQELETTVGSFTSSTGAPIKFSLIPGKGSEILVMRAPFSDGAPRGSVESAPNSRNQATKSSFIAQLLKATGREMSVLTILSPFPGFPFNAYTHGDYALIRRGNFSPDGRVIGETLEVAQDRLHGPRSETQLDRLHLQGASQGANAVIGATVPLLLADQYDLRSVTAQELIIGPRNVPDLAARFILGGVVGKKSDLVPDKAWRVLAEPLIRQHIESYGTEPMMYGRMIQGMSKLSRLKGLTRPKSNLTPVQLDALNWKGVSTVVALAENSGLTKDTPTYLPSSGEHVINIRATQGERVGHEVDEHVGATALIAAMHIHQT